MNIYIDESGSINNHSADQPYFIIALLCATEKDRLKRAYKRFVSSHYDRLKELDELKKHPVTGRVIRENGKMFSGSKFRELKGARLDREMKRQFVEFFSRKPTFEIYYIKISTDRLTDHFCENTARVFNYSLKLALEFFLRNGFFPHENYSLQLDERNEKTESRFFLENYLNTELSMNGASVGRFDVSYFDSADNGLIQIADVFANLYYSHLLTGCYGAELSHLAQAGILRFVFEFPLGNSKSPDDLPSHPLSWKIQNLDSHSRTC